MTLLTFFGSAYFLDVSTCIRILMFFAGTSVDSGSIKLSYPNYTFRTSDFWSRVFVMKLQGKADT